MNSPRRGLSGGALVGGLTRLALGRNGQGFRGLVRGGLGGGGSEACDFGDGCEGGGCEGGGGFEASGFGGSGSEGGGFGGGSEGGGFGGEGGGGFEAGGLGSDFEGGGLGDSGLEDLF